MEKSRARRHTYCAMSVCVCVRKSLDLMVALNVISIEIDIYTHTNIMTSFMAHFARAWIVHIVNESLSNQPGNYFRLCQWPYHYNAGGGFVMRVSFKWLFHPPSSAKAYPQKRRDENKDFSYDTSQANKLAEESELSRLWEVKVSRLNVENVPNMGM